MLSSIRPNTTPIMGTKASHTYRPQTENTQVMSFSLHTTRNQRIKDGMQRRSKAYQPFWFSCWIRSEGDILKDHYDEKGSTCNPSQQWMSHFETQFAVVVVDLKGLLIHWETPFTPEWGLQIYNNSNNASFEPISCVSRKKNYQRPTDFNFS